MKILLLNLMMSVASCATDANEVEDYSWVLDELNTEAVTMAVSVNAEEKIRIFDTAGNLLEEILKADYIENTMKGTEIKMISKSAHMFDYLGDSYFILEE